MSHRGLDPRDYEYDGSESAEAYSSAPAAENAVSERSSRFRFTSAVTTVVLASAGLLGGAAFAMSQAGLGQSPSSAPIVETPNTTDGGTAATANTPSPSPSDSSASSAAESTGASTTGKTIAVPPAAFEDKHGERDFHTSSPAAASSSATATPAPSAAAPKFGGGGEGGDDGGEHHHKRGTPAPGSSTSPNFGNNEDD